MEKLSSTGLLSQKTLNSHMQQTRGGGGSFMRSQRSRKQMFCGRGPFTPTLYEASNNKLVL